jgi:4-nitrophenyl phosphatase
MLDRQKLGKYSTILLDGDGVLWKSNQPQPGLKEFFDFIDDQEIKWALLTNNNTRSVADYVEKLTNFGVTANSNKVFTSSTAAADYLLDRFGKGAHLYVVGMTGLTVTLEDAGFKLTLGDQKPEDPVAAVVAGMDININHQKIKTAMKLILGGAAFIATNRDGSYPTPEGPSPGTGMVIAAIEAASGVKPYVAGKPYPAIFNSALKQLNSNPDQVLMVGDRLNTDIQGAEALGIDTAAVLSGITSLEEIKQSPLKPDFIFQDLADLHQNLLEVYKT